MLRDAGYRDYDRFSLCFDGVLRVVLVAGSCALSGQSVALLPLEPPEQCFSSKVFNQALSSVGGDNSSSLVRVVAD